MKINNIKTLYDHKMLAHRSQGSKLKKFDENADIKNNNNLIRPAQALSFSGSAVSLGEKISGAFVQSKAANGIIAGVSENEAAWNAVYALVLAGVLKPYFVMKQKGEEKDKQMIAVKNFLQAFIGSFLAFTIGGGVVKKIYDNIANNLNLIEVVKKGDKDALQVVDKNSDTALDIAKGILRKESNTFKNRFEAAKEAASNASALAKPFSFVKNIFKDAKIEPSQDAIKEKASLITQNCAKNHLGIFEKNIDFVKILKNDADKATSFEACWKNSTGFITAITKAKISSALLPSVVAFIFAKKNLEMKQEEDRKKLETAGMTLVNNPVFKDKNKRFDLSSIESKKENNNPKADINFKGKLADPVVNILTKGFENISMSKGGQKAVDALQGITKFTHSNPSAIMSDFESFALTGYWLANTQASKKIDPEQKLGLNVHTALVTVVATICAHAVDALFNPLINKAKETYSDKVRSVCNNVQDALKQNKDADIKPIIEQGCAKLLHADELKKALKSLDFNDAKAVEKIIKDFTKTYNKGLSKVKSLTVFTCVVRFLVPVLTVNASAKLKKKLVEFSKNRANKNENQAKKPDIKIMPVQS